MRDAYTKHAVQVKKEKNKVMYNNRTNKIQSLVMMANEQKVVIYKYSYSIFKSNKDWSF